MSANQSFNLSICLTSLFASLSASLSASVPADLSASLSASLSAILSTGLRVCRSVCSVVNSHPAYLPVCLPVGQYFYRQVCPSNVHLSASPRASLSVGLWYSLSVSLSARLLESVQPSPPASLKFTLSASFLTAAPVPIGRHCR